MSELDQYGANIYWAKNFCACGKPSIEVICSEADYLIFKDVLSLCAECYEKKMSQDEMVESENVLG